MQIVGHFNQYVRSVVKQATFLVISVASDVLPLNLINLWKSQAAAFHEINIDQRKRALGGSGRFDSQETLVNKIIQI